MKKRLSLPALAVAVAIAGFLTLIMAHKSYAASQSSSNNGVSFSLSGQYIGRGLWAQNQAEVFDSAPGYPTSNTFESFTQRLRVTSTADYGNVGGMPLASLLTQFDLTNNYNPAGGGYGSNGWDTLGYTPAPIGFNHDFNTFGLREAYIRLVSPVGMWMFGRMPVKFGLGIGVNTQADGLGDFLPLKSDDLGVFLGVLFGNETNAGTNGVGYTTPGTMYPSVSPDYTHMQMGTIPTLEIMTLKPVNGLSGSLWLTEAHLNQFGAYPGAQLNPVTGAVNPALPTESPLFPEANITYGGISGTYNNMQGTVVKGEFDYFRGKIICSNAAISAGECAGYLPVTPDVGSNSDKISSYDLYLTGSQAISLFSYPMTFGLTFGIGGPISSGHYDMTYYSQVQNTRTIFGDVLGSNWQTIQFSAPGVGYMWSSNGPWALGTNLANKYGIMGDLTEHLSGSNDVKESLVYMSWLKTSLTEPGASTSTEMFGGHEIGTEFDLNVTHHFSKTLAWQAWGSYVWTGSGVNSFGPAAGISSESDAAHKDVTALGTAIIWNF